VSYESSPPQPPEADQDQVPHTRPLDLVSVRRISSGRRALPGSDPPISIIWSHLFSKISPEPRIPLSFFGEERLQVQPSEIAATDLDMGSCVLNWSSWATNSFLDISRLWLLLRLLKFGVQFSGQKMNALLHGDLSGTVLDRSFVCGSHVLGMMASAGTNDTPAMVLFHARRVQTAWESLAELFGGDNYRTKVQAAALVVSSHVYMCMPQMALFYIQKSCDFIKAGNLRLVPTFGRPPEFSEDLHETLVALSQTVYWANYMFLMRGGPEPRATAKLEMEFRQELPVGKSPSLFLRVELMPFHSELIQSSSRSVL